MPPRILLITIPTILVLTIAWSLTAGESPAKPAPIAFFECRWTDTPIRITGKGDDPAWKNAPRSSIASIFPGSATRTDPPRTRTAAKLLWDREHLYFFADMEDHDLYATVKEHNGQLWRRS